MSTLTTDKLRTLQTAEIALRLIKFMIGNPKGISLEEIAKYVGKSKHTAYYLINTLCQEGFAFQSLDKRYRLTALAQALTPGTRLSLSLSDLKAAGQDLHRRTHERVYLVVHSEEGLNVLDTWGKQGQPGLEGLKSTIREELHALAVGKAVFSSLPKNFFDTYSSTIGLKRFTPNTKCDPDELWQEVSDSLNEGVAMDEEEYSEGFCCLAIPIRLEEGVIASLGMAVPTQRFIRSKDNLVAVLKQLQSDLHSFKGVRSQSVGGWER